MTPVIKRNGNRLHVLPAYGDTIYRVTSEGRIPNYWIDMSRVNGKTSRDFDYPMTDEKFRLMMQDASFFNGLFAESDNFGLFRVFYPKRGKLILYSKQQKKVTTSTWTDCPIYFTCISTRTRSLRIKTNSSQQCRPTVL